MSGKYGQQVTAEHNLWGCRNILAKVKDLSDAFTDFSNNCLLRDSDDYGLRYVGGRWVWLEIDSKDQVKASRLKTCGLPFGYHRAPESLTSLIESFIVHIVIDLSYYATEFAYWRQILIEWRSISSLSPLERKYASGSLVWFLREGVCSWGGSDLVDSFEEGEIRDDSVLYNDECIKDCIEKNLEDDAGEILRVHSQGDCGNVTTDDNENVTPVIAP
ncbi:hypothetical protein Tco_1242566 [Tanacetum coccineum]